MSRAFDATMDGEDRLLVTDEELVEFEKETG